MEKHIKCGCDSIIVYIVCTVLSHESVSSDIQHRLMMKCMVLYVYHIRTGAEMIRVCFSHCLACILWRTKT